MKTKSTQISNFLFILTFIFIVLSSDNISKQMAMAQQNETVSIKVGVVLDMETRVGKIGLSAIQMALTDFYGSHSYYKTRLVLHNRNSKKDVVYAAAAVVDLLKNIEVEVILGPVSSMQAAFIIVLGEKAQVPIVSFTVTDPSLSSPYFLRTTPDDSSQVQAIAAIVQAFGWRQAVPIYVDNVFGKGIIPFLENALDEVNCHVLYRSVIPPLATDDQIVAELYKLMTMQTRVFIVHMAYPLGSRLFTKAKEIGMLTKGYVWIITDGLTNDLYLMDPLVAAESMLGVVGIRPYVPSSEKLKNFNNRWKKQFQQENPTIFNPQLDSYALWAYDSATAIAMAVEETWDNNSGFHKSNVTGNYSTDLETLGVSKNGPKLLRALMETRFRGLSGDFRIIDGQLHSSVYQIVNVIDNGPIVNGYWRRENGIMKKLNFSRPYSTSKDNFKYSIEWPGDTKTVPKGWEFPTNAKKLRIAVPAQNDFPEFVKVTQNSATDQVEVEGYCIDVFETVRARLPYSVPHEFFLYNGSGYNDLVYQVYLGNYDAAVGDFTIVANRSNYVDFTLPYTESGVVMVVPIIRSGESKKAWVFLKPLTWELWLTSLCSCVFLGFLIWILEHRVNEEFRGPPSHQVGTILWFAFSTMVFAQKEKIVSNLARFVLIIWFLVVLILTQSYTANLASMLTVEKLRPTVTDVNELLRNKENVGYVETSFVVDLLKRMNFDESRLIPYRSPEECNELLSKGTKNGGIAAAFDEIPYMKILLAKFCSKYTMVGPIYKTDGFGFVFPIGSPLVPDMSRAILNVTQGETMLQIERKWLGNKTNCQDLSAAPSYNSLGLDRFWGLFLIAGIASISAFVLFMVKFLRENSNFIRRTRTYSSIWSDILELGKRFDNKDFSSHPFCRKSGEEKGSSTSSAEDSDVVEGVDEIDASQSPPFSLHSHQSMPLQVQAPQVTTTRRTTSLRLAREGASTENVNSHPL